VYWHQYTGMCEFPTFQLSNFQNFQLSNFVRAPWDPHPGVLL